MPPRLNSGIGDCLKDWFESWKIKSTPACSCKDIKELLNFTPPPEVESKIDYYVDQVFDNVKNLEGTVGNLVKLGSFLLPGTSKEQIKRALLDCVNKAKAQNAPEAL